LNKSYLTNGFKLEFLFNGSSRDEAKIFKLAFRSERVAAKDVDIPNLGFLG